MVLHLSWAVCSSPPLHKGFCSPAEWELLALEPPQAPTTCFSVTVSDHLSRFKPPNTGQEFLPWL